MGEKVSRRGPQASIFGITEELVSTAESQASCFHRICKDIDAPWSLGRRGTKNFLGGRDGPKAFSHSHMEESLLIFHWSFFVNFLCYLLSLLLHEE